MRDRRIAVIAALLLLLGFVRTGALAACASTASCLEAIEQAHRGMRTLTARFVQTKHLSLLDEPLVSTGRIAFKRPDRMLWQIETPRPLRIVIDGGRLRIPGLSADDQRALSAAPVAPVLSRLGAIFTGDLGGLEESFAVKAEERDGVVSVRLRPRRDELRQAVHAMELRFARPELLLQKIRLRNGFGDTLEIALEEQRRNADVADAEFADPEQ